MLTLLVKLRLWLNRALALIASLFLAAMVVLACWNMVARAMGYPVKGSFELMGFFGAVVAAFSLGYAQLGKGHIAVDYLKGKLPPVLERVFDAAGYLVAALFFALCALEVDKLADFLLMTGELAEALRFPYHHFVYAVAFGCAAMALTLAVDFLLCFFPNREQTGSA